MTHYLKSWNFTGFLGYKFSMVQPLKFYCDCCCLTLLSFHFAIFFQPCSMFQFLVILSPDSELNYFAGVIQWRLWAEIEAHKWPDLELNLSKTVEELSQDSQLIQANSKKKLRDNKKLLECSFAQIQFQITSLDFRWRLGPWLIVCIQDLPQGKNNWLFVKRRHVFDDFFSENTTCKQNNQ